MHEQKTWVILLSLYDTLRNKSVIQIKIIED